MGSKTALLRGDLGKIVLEQVENANRFVDLFAGSGAVSHYVAERAEIPVLSNDLQNYSRSLSASITERDVSFSARPFMLAWIQRARKIQPKREDLDFFDQESSDFSKAMVLRERDSAAKLESTYFIAQAYGGHYFSGMQAVALDSLYKALPVGRMERTLCMAALIKAASAVAASPGHTAQPFQPSSTLLPYIRGAWRRDVYVEVERFVLGLAARHALRKGKAIVGDAQSMVSRIREGDLVFCDPPYSSVQYSRFYHVLEGISLGGWAGVSGAGRAPDRVSRVSSSFSMKTSSKQAMADLLKGLRAHDCRVIITFPSIAASNGLSGNDIVAAASRDWRAQKFLVDSVHSTLGGSSVSGRVARLNLQELVLVLDPK